MTSSDRVVAPADHGRLDRLPLDRQGELMFLPFLSHPELVIDLVVEVAAGSNPPP
jgi:hypothetical protein